MPQASEQDQREAPLAKDARRQQYIDAAATIFYRRGYDTATLGDLAQLMGVTKAAMYYYVDNKEGLLYEIIREMHMLNLANLDAARESEGSALVRLHRYFNGHIRINLQYLEKATVVYRDLDHLSPERRSEIVALRDQTQDFVRDLLSQGVAEESVCRLLDVEFASIQMFAAANAVHGWYHPTGRTSVRRVAEAVTEFALAGVMCAGDDDRSCTRHHPIA
jgi:TetR/AcrR family transcriptional regulator, cholesterol catabolism regulator